MVGLNLDEYLAPPDPAADGVDDGVSLDDDDAGDLLPEVVLENEPSVVESAKVVGWAVRGQRWSDEMEQRRASIWQARHLAIEYQFQMGLEYSALLDAYEVVTRLELALVLTFRESVPEPGLDWDLQRRAREIERRLARLRWIERERNVEYNGVKGWLKKVIIGDRRGVTGKELYHRMLAESDVLLRGRRLSADAGGGDRH